MKILAVSKNHWFYISDLTCDTVLKIQNLISNSKFNYLFREGGTKMIIGYIWILSLIQTAFVVRCSSQTCVAAVWMMWVLFVVGERVFCLLHLHSPAHTRISCPLLADVGCQPNENSREAKLTTDTFGS